MSRYLTKIQGGLECVFGICFCLSSHTAVADHRLNPNEVHSPNRTYYTSFQDPLTKEELESKIKRFNEIAKEINLLKSKKFIDTLKERAVTEKLSRKEIDSEIEEERKKIRDLLQELREIQDFEVIPIRTVLFFISEGYKYLATIDAGFEYLTEALENYRLRLEYSKAVLESYQEYLPKDRELTEGEKKHLRGHIRKVAEGQWDYSRFLSHIGNYQKARTVMLDSLRNYEELSKIGLSVDTSRLRYVRKSYASLLVQLQDYKKAETEYKWILRELDVVDKMKKMKRSRGDINYLIARMHGYAGNFEASRSYYREAVKWWEEESSVNRQALPIGGLGFSYLDEARAELKKVDIDFGKVRSLLALSKEHFDKVDKLLAQSKAKYSRSRAALHANFGNIAFVQTALVDPTKSISIQKISINDKMIKAIEHNMNAEKEDKNSYGDKYKGSPNEATRLIKFANIRAAWADSLGDQTKRDEAITGYVQAVRILDKGVIDFFATSPSTYHLTQLKKRNAIFDKLLSLAGNGPEISASQKRILFDLALGGRPLTPETYERVKAGALDIGDVERALGGQGAFVSIHKHPGREKMDPNDESQTPHKRLMGHFTKQADQYTALVMTRNGISIVPLWDAQTIDKMSDQERYKKVWSKIRDSFGEGEFDKVYVVGEGTLTKDSFERLSFPKTVKIGKKVYKIEGSTTVGKLYDFISVNSGREIPLLGTQKLASRRKGR